ncbi:Ribonuclease H-like domain [Cinara cedri]|uniref:Ribonuclease H-like domain n=1 Tax=Cinara cedri TaxID=506608 RepID=A0A5E4MIR1_9HEMI|nr:Ribonuclease H-like domain [Cinara cedri]
MLLSVLWGFNVLDPNLYSTQEQLEKPTFLRSMQLIKAGQLLKMFYSKMVHVTCAAYCLYRTAEQVRDHFSAVEKLIENCKKVFKKAPTRDEMFEKEAPGVCLPPDPVITRWGSWINAAIYYCENLNTVCRIMTELDDDDAVSTKKYIVKPGLESNLAYIKSNFTIFVLRINKLQTKDLSLTAVLKIIEDIEDSFKSLMCEADGDLEELASGDIVYFKYSPFTSVDVERSFSTYKTFLTDNLRSFKFENLAKHLVMQCNSDNFE